MRADDAPRIGPSEAHRLVQEENALLVCAYDDEQKCSNIAVDGSISFPELERRLDSLSTDQHLVFY